MAHVRRKFLDIFASQGSAIAQEAITRIALLYAVEDKARGLALADRVALRQAEAKPVVLGRKNRTFVGSEGGGKAMAIAYTLRHKTVIKVQGNRT